MRRTLWLVGILLFLGLVGLGVVRWRQRGGPFVAQTFKLKNGAEITLTAVQFGKRHVDPFAGPQEQFLARIPGTLVDRLPWKTTARFGNPVNASNTFLSCCLAFPSNVVSGPNFGGSQQLGLWVTEDPGGQSWKSHNSNPRNGVTSTGRRYEVHAFPIFPRRSEWLRVVVTDSPWGGKPLGEYRIRNPGWDPSTPVQIAPPLPQSVIQDDLTFTLQSLQVRSNRGDYNDGMPKWSARLEFTVETAGRPSTNWESYHVARVLDDTGNEGDGNSWSHGFKDGRTYVEFSRQPLPPGDPWKVQVEFCQLSGFATNELWSLRAVPIQAGTMASARTNRMSGTLVELRSLEVDPQRYRPAPANTNDPVAVILKLKAQSAPDSRRWHLTIVRARDDQGRDVTDNSWSGSDEDREFRFQIAPGVKSMDFDLAYAPSRMVWFHAQPTVSTNR